jgi:DNA polymerase bacteriophage-type
VTAHLHIDFETRSTVDLKAAGLDNYAKHPATDVLCMGFATGDGPVDCMSTEEAEICAAILPVFDHVESGGIVLAHNAAFELAIWNHICVPRYGFPELKPEQTRCTMAMAYAMALPGSLEKAAAAVGIPQQKDLAGHRLMMQMCKPKADGGWWDDADKLEKLYAYCKQDVEVERALAKRLMPLSESEQALWVLDQTINNRGVYVDRKAVDAAVRVVQTEADRLNACIRDLTDNFVGFTTEHARIAKWLNTQGVIVPGVAKADVTDALTLPDLPEKCREVLLVRQEAGKSSTAKLRAMAEAAGEDNRLRGMFQYHGAGTGRWAGRKVQLQNMPRPHLPHDEIDRAIETMSNLPTVDAVKAIGALYGQPLDIISWSLRGMLTAAPGNTLYAADFANIEGRGLAWLAGEEWKLDAFRAYDAGTGPDLYKVSAHRIYGTPVADVDGDQRQIGKVAELACGYGGGVGAFQQMAKNYQMKISDELAESIKTRWRDAHPGTVNYWYDVERAAVEAVLNIGRTTTAGAAGRQVKYKVSGSFLWCLLPSGRAICYPYPKMQARETPWGELKDQLHYMTVNSTTNKWEETHTYGGKLVENITQAVCRDLLAYSMFAAEAAGYPVVLHVHDEVVSERKAGKGGAKEFEEVCSGTPLWAKGLPVVAAGWTGRRYRK